MAFWSTYFSATDVDAAAKAITGAGGKVSFGPMEVMDQGRMLVGQDPAGAMFGVWEPRTHQGSELVNEDGAPTWNELYTRDLEASTRFYGAVFGHAFDPLPELPDDYRLVRVGDDVVAGMMQMTDAIASPEMPPYWLNYFELDDVDAGFARVRELGGEVLSEPRDSPYGRWAPVRDPQGGVFALIHGASPQ
jgi:predicted enzyme related to lactoylglutathione lyase